MCFERASKSKAARRKFDVIGFRNTVLKNVTVSNFSGSALFFLITEVIEEKE